VPDPAKIPAGFIREGSLPLQRSLPGGCQRAMPTREFVNVNIAKSS
jgi:hypothetical protein